jgi:hypothetical protein
MLEKVEDTFDPSDFQSHVITDVVYSHTKPITKQTSFHANQRRISQ